MSWDGRLGFEAFNLSTVHSLGTSILSVPSSALTVRLLSWPTLGRSSFSCVEGFKMSSHSKLHGQIVIAQRDVRAIIEKGVGLHGLPQNHGFVLYLEQFLRIFSLHCSQFFNWSAKADSPARSLSFNGGPSVNLVT